MQEDFSKGINFGYPGFLFLYWRINDILRFRGISIRQNSSSSKPFPSFTDDFIDRSINGKSFSTTSKVNCCQFIKSIRKLDKKLLRGFSLNNNEIKIEALRDIHKLIWWLSNRKWVEWLLWGIRSNLANANLFPCHKQQLLICNFFSNG